MNACFLQTYDLEDRHRTYNFFTNWKMVPERLKLGHVYHLFGLKKIPGIESLENVKNVYYDFL